MAGKWAGAKAVVAEEDAATEEATEGGVLEGGQAAARAAVRAVPGAESREAGAAVRRETARPATRGRTKGANRAGAIPVIARAVAGAKGAAVPREMGAWGMLVAGSSPSVGAAPASARASASLVPLSDVWIPGDARLRLLQAEAR